MKKSAMEGTEIKNKEIIEDIAPFDDALNLTGLGKYNYIILSITIYSILAATAEMFTIGIITTASQCDLNLDVNTKGLLSAIPILGVVVSAHFWGFLADTRGRRFTLLISTTGSCAAGIIASFATDWVYLAIMKFIGAIFASATNAIGYTFIGETTMTRKRGQYLMYVVCGMSIFQLLNAMMAYPVLGMNFSYYLPILGFSYRPWRLYLQIIGLISGVNALLIALFVLESPKFYFAIGKHDQGLEVLQKIYKINSGNSAEKYLVKKVILNKDDYKTEQRGFFRSIWEQTIPLFSKKYIKSTILIFLTCLPSYCISPPLSVWLPFIFNSYSETKRSDIVFCDIFQMNATQPDQSTAVPECNDRVSDISYIVLAIFAIYLFLSSVLTVVIMKYIGKKWTYISNHVLTGVFGLIINHLDILWGIASMLGMSANVSCIGIVTIYAVELFPTYMRAMAVCLAILFGRSVSVVFYQIMGSQLQNNCNNFLIVISSLLFFGAGVALFLPADTKTKESDMKSEAPSNCNEN